MYGREYKAHVAAWILSTGDQVPEKIVLHHKCTNRPCVNVRHLKPVLDEKHRRMTRLRDRCRRGHERTTRNAGVNSRSHRYCRRCHTEDQKRYRAKKEGNEAPPPKRWNSLGSVTEANMLGVEAVWRALLKKSYPGHFERSWEHREVAMLSNMLREVDLDELEHVLRTVVEDWESFTRFAIEFDGRHMPTRYPRLHYLHRRFEAAVNYHRRRVRRVEAEQKHRAEEEHRLRDREAREERAKELARRPFEEVYGEMLARVVTPGTKLHRTLVGRVGRDLPAERMLRALYERATVEAHRALGRAESEMPFLVERRPDWTEVEYEEYTRTL